MSVQIPKSFSFPLIAPSSMYYTYYSTDTARRTNNMMGRAYITTGPTEGHWWGAKYGIVWYVHIEKEWYSLSHVIKQA